MSKGFHIDISQSEVDSTKCLDTFSSSSNRLRIEVKRERWVQDGTWQQVEVNGSALIGFRERERAERFATKLAELIRNS